MKKIILFLGVALLVTFFPLETKANVGQSTSAIWDHHVNSWSLKDMKAILSDYTDESVVMVQDQEYKGKKQIEGLFNYLFNLFREKDSQSIKVKKVNGRFIYITWTAHIGGVDYPVGSDTFMVENGKIVFQSIAADPKLMIPPKP